MEQRGATIEVRAKSGRKLEGFAALYGVETHVSDPARGTFRETIRAGAFADSLKADVLAIRDHDPTRLLGRTRSGTLRLGSDSRGLQFEIDLPDTSEGRDTLALAERGDLGGMSFGFDVPAGGDTWTGDRRELRSVVLHEISVVSHWPAYPGTVIDVRAGLIDARLGPLLARRWLETAGA